MAAFRERQEAPVVPIDVTPEEYERTVLEWLRKAAPANSEFSIQHQGIVKGAGGDYAIDVLVSLRLFCGAEVAILAECKRLSRRVERDEVLKLEAKVRDVGAHKGMLFATCGFQQGALRYAQAHGIATITFIDGSLLYETKSLDPPPQPPPWLQLPRFAGVVVTPFRSGYRCQVVANDELGPISAFLEQNQ